MSQTSPPAAPTEVSAWQFDLYVSAEADGVATPHEVAVLEADRLGWHASLARLLRETDEHLASARTLPGKERDQVVADLTADRRRLAAARTRLMGDPRGDVETRRPARDDDEDDEPVEPGVVQLQVCWEPGRVVAWAAGPGTPTADADEVMEMLAVAGAPSSGWLRHSGVPLPGGLSAEAFTLPIGEVLGWLVAAGADQAGDAIGPSVRWLGRVAIWAVELTARGSMVPLLRQRKRGSGGTRDVNGSYSVRWTPALIDPARLADVAKRVPGSVLALEPSVDARADALGADRHGRRDLSRQRAPHRGSGPATAGAHGCRRHGGVSLAARRQCVRCAVAGGWRDRDTRRAMGALGHTRARTVGGAARASR